MNVHQYSFQLTGSKDRKVFFRAWIVFNQWFEKIFSNADITSCQPSPFNLSRSARPIPVHSPVVGCIPSYYDSIMPFLPNLLFHFLY